MTATDTELAELVADYYDDPLGYVECMFPWGERGELELEDGPDTWQRKMLIDIGAAVKERRAVGINPLDPLAAVNPLRFAVASGHGIGKGVMMAWIACWIMDTREHSQGTITANTGPQLASKTWPAVQRWRRLSLTRDWWIINSEAIHHRDAKDQWWLRCQTCAEENSEAFAGQHKRDSTSYYLFDEASAIPAIIWEKADGGLTDGEPMFFAFGNPTRNYGEFYDVCFGHKRHRWNVRSIDSRTCKFPNKAEIDQWIEDYGIESDRVRYQVLGQPPQTNTDQLIPTELVEQARMRTYVEPEKHAPLICGVDVPDGGSAWFIVRYRRGNDARHVPPPIRIAGSKVDRPMMIATLARILKDQTPGRKVSMMFIDSAFGSPICERLHALNYDNVCEVNFGGKSPDTHYANMRSSMWNSVKDWLDRGGMLVRDDVKLQVDLTSPGFHLNQNQQIVLESKEAMRNPPKGSGKPSRPSPDDGDALALTFAAPVAPIVDEAENPRYTSRAGGRGDSWMR